jgi:putative transposase
LDGIFYVNRTGCQWRYLPKSFGHWNTVYSYFNRWSKAGTWSCIMEHLRHQERTRQGRAEEPSTGCVDSQSVKTITYGDSRGFDGGKKVKGRKRHILVDTLGLLVMVTVTAANVGDRDGLMQLLTTYFRGGVKRLRKLWVDDGYSGAPLRHWVRALKKTHKIDLDVSGRIGPGFKVVAKRWVVERTFGWLNLRRRLSKDYEVLTPNSEAMIQVAFITILIRRLA